jgi:hypothetical protein
MTRALFTLAIVAGTMGGSLPAHHSYAAFEMNRLVEIEGIVEAVEWVAPHALITLRADDSRRYTFSWRAPAALHRVGVSRDALPTGERFRLAGHPRRDLEETGVLTLRSIQRLSDGWTWPSP